jgi:hypothetical protein
MMRSRDNEAQMDELGDDPGQVGPDSGGQSGDTQGLSEIADGTPRQIVARNNHQRRRAGRPQRGARIRKRHDVPAESFDAPAMIAVT